MLGLIKQKNMKKALIILALTVFISSCSKDEDSTTKQLPLTYESFTGRWDFSQIQKTDGSFVTFEGRCSSKKDYIVFSSNGKITRFTHGINCNDPLGNIETDDYFFEGNKMKNSGFLFNGAIVKEITANKFYVEFPNNNSLNDFSRYEFVKGIVFTR
jgi:hypothetical protein